MADESAAMGEAQAGQRLLGALERLLEIPATDLRSALDGAAQLLAEVFQADKVDALLYDPSIESLVALGTSDTPMGHRQRALGLDRLPIANQGRTVWVFETGTPYLTGHADEDPLELVGVTRGLGVRSTAAVPLEAGRERRGVLLLSSAQPDAFTEQDLRFLQAAARWVGGVAHRGEMVEQLTQAAEERGRTAAAEELIMVLAHDLRNHLTPLKGRLELIRRRAARAGDAKYLQDADEMTGALRRLEQMIAGLLDVARLEQGLFALDCQPVDLVALIQQTAEVFRAPGVDVRLQVPEELDANVDPERIRQALENLLANAVKYSPPGAPVLVELSSEPRSDGEWAVLSVSDQGPGIPPELLPHLFERFSSGPGSTGLGIGLYLSRRIAEAHGGTLTAESSPAAGARFTLSLPT